MIYTQLLSDSTSDKKNLTELKEKSDAICKQIEELKMKIFQATEQTAATKINYDEIYYPDNYDIPTLITWREDMMPKPIVTSLSDNLNKFNDYVKSTFNQNSASLIDLSDETLTCLLRNLNQLQIEIRLIESNCMK